VNVPSDEHHQHPALPPAVTRIPRQETRSGTARRVIASATDQPAADRARNYLIDTGIPGSSMTTVARDVTEIPRPAAPTTLHAAVRGAVPGLIFGGMSAVLLRLGDDLAADMPLGPVAVAAAVAGATVGAFVAVLGYGLFAARRTGRQQPMLAVGHFDLLVEADIADEAVRLLHRATMPALLQAGDEPPATPHEETKIGRSSSGEGSGGNRRSTNPVDP